MSLKFKIYLLLSCINLILSGCSNFEVSIPAHDEDEEIIILEFLNYKGNTQNIHPKVLYFDEGWCGYEYWMAYTPYPKGNVKYENPCIAVSHDGINWMQPIGLENPMAQKPKDGYNSDSHLVYDQENDTMEIWWRPYSEKDGAALYRRTSRDGINWNEAECILDRNQLSFLLLSPTIWIENDEYLMIFSDNRNLKFTRANRYDYPMLWSDPIDVAVNWGDLVPWHLDVIPDGWGNYELLVCCYDKDNGNNNSADLYYLKLNSFFEPLTLPLKILTRGDAYTDFDHRSIYRSSMIKKGGEVYLYYSAIDEKWGRHIALKIYKSGLADL